MFAIWIHPIHNDTNKAIINASGRHFEPLYSYTIIYHQRMVLTNHINILSKEPRKPGYYQRNHQRTIIHKLSKESSEPENIIKGTNER